MTKYFQRSRMLRTARSMIWMAVILATGISCDAFAGISTDNSLGHPAQTLAGPSYLISESLGKLSGNNLFHSFQTFNILTNESAKFTTTTSGIANVISRVTGGSLSQINGQFSLTPCTGCGAPNFFFINPAGVTFGAGASIDVPGAFHVSTADYIKFPDGNFYADTAKTSSFSSAPPEAFGFLGTTRASVTVNGGATLSTQPLQPISIVASGVVLDNGSVSTLDGGDIRVVALGQSAQEVGLTGVLAAAGGDLSILNGGYIYSKTGSAIDSGSINISAGNVTLDGGTGYSSISSDANADIGNGGNIDVAATGNLSISSGYIYSSTQSSGNAGAVKVSAGNIAIDGLRYASIISAATAGTGNAGSVDVSATGNLSITNGGAMSSSTWSSGAAGSIKVSSGNITIDGSVISSNAESGSTGNAGSVEVSATGNLSIINGGRIFSTAGAWSSGNAGPVKIGAGSIVIDGQGSSGATGINSETGNSSTGNAGSVEVLATGNLSIINGGRIFSTAGAWSSGNGSPVKVGADSIVIDGQGNGKKTGILSDTKFGSTSNASTIEVSATGKLSIVNGGDISSDTFSSGDAGYIRVGADSITIDGQGSGFLFTGISSVASGLGTGNAGKVNVSATENLSIVNGGAISTSTFSSGIGGSVKVAAGSIVIDGQGQLFLTGIKSDAHDAGNAGSVEITAAGNLSIVNGGQISSSTSSSGNGGSVKVAAGSIVMDGQGHLWSAGLNSDTSGTGDAGSIEVSASGDLSIINNGRISSSTFSSGNGGSVKVGAGRIVINGQGGFMHTQITSDAGYGSTGHAGSVEVTATGSLSIINGGQISSRTSSTGNAGSVKVGADSIVIDQQGSSNATGILSDANSGSTGDAGSVEVTASRNLSIVNGGRISSIAFSSGNGGSVKVGADSIVIDGQGKDSGSITGIFSDAVSGTGHAGSVEVTATGNLSIINGGRISSIAFSSGNGGSVKVGAGSIIIDRQGSNDVTGILSDAVSGTGHAGSVEVTATGNLYIVNGGTISSNTWSSGNAGTVTVNANTLLVDSDISSISATAAGGSSGQTGSVIVTATDSITLSNGGQISISNDANVAAPSVLMPTSISVSAPRITVLNSPNAITTLSTGNIAAGSIKIIASDRFYLDPSGITTTSNQGNGGAIDITAGMLRLDNSQIATSVTGLAGNGGNIAINANSLVLNTGFIQANTAAANATGGTVLIAVQNLIPSGNTLFLGGSTPYTYQPGVFGFNVIQAAAPTGVSGAVQTTTPVLDISGSLTGLNTQVIDTGGLGRSPCQVSGGSSLAQSGRGGLPPSARGLLRAEMPFSSARTGFSLPVSGDDMRLVSFNWGCS